MRNIISGHNNKILNNQEKDPEEKKNDKTCNCRKKQECPLNGKCLIESVIYKVTVKTED